MNLENKYGITVSTEIEKYRTPTNLTGEFERCLDIAKQTGYDAVEIQTKDYEKLDVIRMKQLCDERSLAIAALSVGKEATHNGYNFSDENEKNRQASIRRFMEYIELSRCWGATLIIGYLRGNLPDQTKYEQYYNRLYDSLKILSADAEKKQVVMVLEAFNIYVMDWMNTIADNMAMIRDVNSPNLKIHIDTHHINIDETGIDESVEQCKDIIAYIHLSDSNRLYPGGGHFDFLRFMKKTMRLGYGGYYTMECFPFPSQQECAAISLNYIKGIEMAIRALPF
ncbi:MAG: sugar phosphate isomerase/epimerase family protein [Christensenellales bacterium]